MLIDSLLLIIRILLLSQSVIGYDDYYPYPSLSPGETIWIYDPEVIYVDDQPQSWGCQENAEFTNCVSPCPLTCDRIWDFQIFAVSRLFLYQRLAFVVASSCYKGVQIP